MSGARPHPSAGNGVSALVMERSWAETVTSKGAGTWRLPISVFDSPAGFETSYGGGDLSTDILSFTLAGALVERVAGTCRGLRAQGLDAFGFLPTGSDGGFRARGGIRHLQLYLPASLKAVWSGELEGSAGSLRLDREDLMFVEDAEVSTMVRTYADRALADASALEMDSRAHLIGLLLFERYGQPDGSPGRRSTGGLAPWRLRRACDAMLADLSADITLSDLASAVGLSETHFSRAFKQSMGFSPFGWLMRERLTRAKRLLAAGDLPLAEISIAVGFSAQPAFTTAFRRATGVTPGAWRRDRRT